MEPPGLEQLVEGTSMQQAMDSAKSAPEGERRVCLNCGSELKGKFCSQCGQKDMPKRQSLGELIFNFISSFWNYESKFIKTTRFLLFKPGFLPAEYCAGKRESYFHPARAYVFISFIYFLLFFSLPNNEEMNDAVVVEEGNDKFKVSSEYSSRKQYDSLQSALPLNERDGWLMRKTAYKSLDLYERFQGDKNKLIEDVKGSFAANTPKIFFLLLPLFALILKLLYIRRDYYYSEHLVFSIYYYNFFFLAGSLYLLINLVAWLQWLSVLIGIGIALYLLWGMKRMYKQGWGKTIAKYCVFGFVFTLCVIAGLMINLLVILIFV